MALSRGLPSLTGPQIGRAICQRPTDAIYVYTSVCFGWHQNGAISLFLHCPISFESLVTLFWQAQRHCHGLPANVPRRGQQELCSIGHIPRYVSFHAPQLLSNVTIVAANDYFLDHSSRDVRLLVACSIADVFRVYAPNAPYETTDIIKRIFLFFIQQLSGLQDPKDATFKRYFYLLEVGFIIKFAY